MSYTNEGNDAQAHEALERWIELGDGAGAVSEAPGETAEERQARIVERLIAIARQRPDDLDVDVQVALGVLFNSSEVSLLPSLAQHKLTMAGLPKGRGLLPRRSRGAPRREYRCV